MDPAIGITRAAAEDSGAVLDLWRQAEATPSPTDTLEAVARLARDPAAVLLLARHGARVVGTVIAGWDGWRGNIYRLAVLPEYRRRGIARELVQRAEEALREKGAARISALVEHEHPWAVGFWDALAEAGYRRDRRMIRYVKALGPGEG